MAREPLIISQCNSFRFKFINVTHKDLIEDILLYKTYIIELILCDNELDTNSGLGLGF